MLRLYGTVMLKIFQSSGEMFRNCYILDLTGRLWLFTKGVTTNTKRVYGDEFSPYNLLHTVIDLRKSS